MPDRRARRSPRQDHQLLVRAHRDHRHTGTRCAAPAAESRDGRAAPRGDDRQRIGTRPSRTRDRPRASARATAHARRLRDRHAPLRALGIAANLGIDEQRIVRQAMHDALRRDLIMNRQNGEQRIERQRTTIVVADEQRGPRGRRFRPREAAGGSSNATAYGPGRRGPPRAWDRRHPDRRRAAAWPRSGDRARRAKGCSGCRAGSKATDHDHRSRRSRVDTTAAGGRAGIGWGSRSAFIAHSPGMSASALRGRRLCLGAGPRPAKKFAPLAIRPQRKSLHYLHRHKTPMSSATSRRPEVLMQSTLEARRSVTKPSLCAADASPRSAEHGHGATARACALSAGGRARAELHPRSRRAGR